MSQYVRLPELTPLNTFRDMKDGYVKTRGNLRNMRMLAYWIVLGLVCETTHACTTTTSGDDETGDGDGDGDSGDTMTPVIEVLLVDGSDAPAPVEMARAIEILVEASDPDGSVVEAQFRIDDQPWMIFDGPGPYLAEYIVGGEDFNGSHAIEVVVVDDTGLTVTSEVVVLVVDVVGGAMVEIWEYDGDEDEQSMRLWVDPDGTELVVAGLASGQGRVDRLIGGDWADKTVAGIPIVNGLTGVPGGEFLMIGGYYGQTEQLRYANDGTLISAESFVWPLQDDWDETSAVKLESDAAGNVYAAGITIDGSTNVVKLAPDGTVVWSHFDDFDTSYPFGAWNLDVGKNDIVLAGTQDDAGPRNAVVRYNLAGELMAVISPFEGGLALDAAVDDNGEVLVGGLGEFFVDNGVVSAAWLQRYDDDGQTAKWTVQVSSEADDVYTSVVAVDIDPFGGNVAAFYEDCPGLDFCDLHVRKYDQDGNEVWEFVESGNKFVDYTNADLVTDRFGYVYVTGAYLGPNGNRDWWVAKIHP